MNCHVTHMRVLIGSESSRAINENSTKITERSRALLLRICFPQPRFVKLVILIHDNICFDVL